MARWVSKLGIWVNTPSKELRQFAGTARGAAGALRSVAHALDFTNAAGTRSFQLNKTLNETAAQMSTSTSALTDQVINLSNATGLSTEKTTALVQSFAAAGQEIDNIDPRLAELTGRYNMSTQGAAQLAAYTRNLGTTITSLTDDVALFQGQFKIPGMLQQLPAVVSHAQDALSEFGEAVVGDSRHIIEHTLKTGAVYAKTFGVEMPQAIQAAQQSESKFASSLSNSRRVFLGLAKDFDGLTMSLLETGMMGFDEVRESIREGMEDPLKFANHIKKLEDTMRAAGNTFGADRLHENILMNAPEAVKKLLNVKGALEAANKAQRESARIAATDVGKGAGAFDGMTSSLKDTAATAIETFKNLLSLGKTIIGLAVADDINQMFKGLNGTLQGLNVRIKKFTESVTTSKAFQTLRPIVHGIGKALIVVGTAAGAAASAFSSMLLTGSGFLRIASFITGTSKSMTGLGTAIGNAAGRFMNLFGGGGRVTRAITFLPRLIGGTLAKIVGPVTSIVGRVGSLLLGGFGVVAGKLAKFFLGPFQAIKAVFVALNDIGKAFRDPDLSPAQKMVKVLRGVFVGLANFIDSIFLGIPSFLMRTFFPSMGRSLEGGVKKLFRQFERWIAGDGGGAMARGWAKIKDVLAGALNATRDWFIGNLNTWHQGMSEFGRNVGRALGEIAKMVGRGVRAMFSVQFWSDAWESVMDWFSTSGNESASGAFGDIFATILDGVVAFGESFADELLHAFGGSLAEAVGLFQDYGTDIAKFFDHMGTGIVDFVTHPIDTGIKLFSDFVFKVESVFADLLDFMGGIWDQIRGVVGTAVGALIDKTIKPLVTIMGKVGLVSQDTVNAVSGFGTQVAASIATSNPADAMRKKIVEQQAAVRQYLSGNEDLEKSKKALEKRDADRDAESLKRQQAMAAKVAADNKKRSEETEKFKAAKELLATSKKAGESQLGSIIDSLTKQLDAAQKSGKRNEAATIQKRLDKAQDYLERVKDASKPETVKKVLDRASKLVPAAPEKGAPAPGAPMPEKSGGLPPTSAALGAGTMKPTPAPKPAAPEVSVKTEQKVKVELVPKGDAAKLFERKQAEAMTRTGGGIGGH